MNELITSTLQDEDLEVCRSAHGDLDKKQILEHMQSHDVQFLRLQFTDITGVNKNVEVPASQFEKALDGEIMFDGSSIEGFTRIEESDMLLKPDLMSYRIDPWVSVGQGGRGHGRVARLICDVYKPDETPFEGCPRQTLKRVCAQASELGYVMNAGPEAEFFLFMRGPGGEATTETTTRRATSTWHRSTWARPAGARS